MSRQAMVYVFLALLCLVPSAAYAKPVSMLGTWIVKSDAPAPWIQSGDKPVLSDEKALIGHQMVFTKTKVSQPSPPLDPNCKPNYQVHNYTDQDLFEGGLTDPKKQAAALGFKGNTVPTMDTGCEGVAEFHFLDDDTVLFALNNSIYRMERAKN